MKRQSLPTFITFVALVLTLGLAPSWSPGRNDGVLASASVREAALRDLQGASHMEFMLEPSCGQETEPVRAGEVTRLVVERSGDYRRRMLDVLKTHYGKKSNGRDFLARAVEEQICTKTMLLLSSAANAQSREELTRVVERAEALFPSATAEM